MEDNNVTGEDLDAQMFAEGFYSPAQKDFIVPAWVIDFAEQYHRWKIVNEFLSSLPPTQPTEERKEGEK